MAGILHALAMFVFGLGVETGSTVAAPATPILEPYRKLRHEFLVVTPEAEYVMDLV